MRALHFRCVARKFIAQMLCILLRGAARGFESLLSLGQAVFKGLKFGFRVGVVGLILSVGEHLGSGSETVLNRLYIDLRLLAGLFSLG